jgi:hypothetical protein
MTPYYAEPGITIYHGDCRDVLPTLPKVDLVLTDPPYGIGWCRGLNNARNSKAHDGIVGDEDTSVRDEALAIVRGVRAIVFGSFYAPFPANVKQILVWHKPDDSGVVGSTTGFRRDAEPIFLCGEWSMMTVQASSVFRSNGGQSAVTTATGHPHTKPLKVVADLLRLAGGRFVLDPFMGSGTTLVAAKRLGRRAIGIEIEERYCEIAVRRVQEASMPLFDDPAPEQLALMS